MTPFYFAHGSRRLFGVYNPASDKAGPVRAAVFCNPFGEEYIHSHRAIRQAAVMLGAAGVHSLRFDYFGTGDSAGEMQDADLDIWNEDIRCAIQELRDISGADRVTLVGLRLGALLAARAAVVFSDQVDRLILWDPVLEGQTYLDEQFRVCHSPLYFGRGPVPRPDAAGGGFEVAGYSITSRLARDIRELDVRSFAPRLPLHAFALISGAAEDEVHLRGVFASIQAQIPIQRIEGTPCWEPIWPEPVAVIPAELIKRLVDVTA